LGDVEALFSRYKKAAGALESHMLTSEILKSTQKGVVTWVVTRKAGLSLGGGAQNSKLQRASTHRPEERIQDKGNKAEGELRTFLGRGGKKKRTTKEGARQHRQIATARGRPEITLYTETAMAQDGKGGKND